MSTKIKILLTAFVALSVLYSLVIPLFEGPDEDDHFRYAKFIADHRALPVQLFEPGGGEAGHQGWQPPLYYSLVSLIITPIDTSDYAEHLWRNFAGTPLGDPACCGRNLYYHTDAENFPYTRTALAVHLARLLSILFGAITVSATYALARTLAPQQEWLSLAAASVVAFNPSFLFASALVSNDAPLAAWSALILLMWAKWLNEKSTPTLKSAALLGALIGLALLTKTTALGFIPFSIAVIVVVALRNRDWRFAISASGVILVVIALVAGWWLVRNAWLYGDPLAYQLMTTTALFPRAGLLTLTELMQISLPWLWQTFWGGPTPGDFSSIILFSLAVLTVLALIGVTSHVLCNTSHATRITFAFLAAWLAFILVAQIQFIRLTTGADQGRYLFPAISVIALCLVIGVDEIIRWLSPITHRASRSTHLVLIIVSFFILALFVLFGYTLPAYARPPLLSESDNVGLGNPMQINFADQIELRGYALNTRVAKPGDTFEIELDWRARAAMNESYRAFVHLIGQNDRSAGGADVIPARGAFPTVYWKPGDLLRDVIRVPIAPNAAPGKYRIEVGWYPVDPSSGRLSVVDSGDESVTLDSIKIAPREPVMYSPQTRVPARWKFARLVGYDATREGPSLALTLYWQGLEKFDGDYKVFVHLLDAAGHIVAQGDQEPQAGNYPTTIWDIGEQIRDPYILTMPNATANYTLRVGLYRLDTGARLPLDDGSEFVEIELSAK